MASKQVPTTMKAWQYGSIHNGIENSIKINTLVAVPTPKADQHLVKVLAAAINPVDYKPAEVRSMDEHVLQIATKC